MLLHTLSQFFWQPGPQEHGSHNLIGKRFATTIIVLSGLSFVAGISATVLNWNVILGALILMVVAAMCLMSIKQGWGHIGRPLTVILLYFFLYLSRVTNARPMMQSDTSFLLILYLNLLLPYLMIERRYATLQALISIFILISLIFLNDAIAAFGMVYQPEPGLVLQYTRWFVAMFSSIAAFTYYNNELFVVEKRNKELLQTAEERNRLLIQQAAELDTLHAELVHQEKMTVLQRSFARVSHHLNSPLGALFSSVQQSTHLARLVVRRLVEQPDDAVGTRATILNEYILRAERAELEVSQVHTFRIKRDKTASILGQLRQTHPSLSLPDSEWDTWASQLFETNIPQPIPAPYFSLEARPFLPLLGNMASWIRTNWIEYTTVAALRSLSMNLKMALGTESMLAPALNNLTERTQLILKVLSEQWPKMSWVTEVSSGALHMGVRPIFNTILYNLLTNAAEATNGLGSAQVALVSKTDAIQITITDNGPGIPAQISDQLFKPLATTKVDGINLGLGLYAVKKAVDSQKGSVEVKSKPGQTVFTIYLPWPKVITTKPRG